MKGGSQLFGLWWTVGIICRSFLPKVPSLAFWVAYIILTILLVCAFYALVSLVGWYGQRRELNQPCPHGIPGGRMRLACSACEREEIEQKRLLKQKAEADAESKRRIAEASKLRESELA